MGEIGTNPEGGSCPQPEISKSLTGYCFGDLSPEERDRFEAHLLDCNACWAELQRLDSVVRALRSDKRLSRKDFFPDIVTATGVSARLAGFAGGHALHAVVAASLYATLFAVSVFMEIAYQYDRYSRMAWTAAPLVSLWVCATTLGILAFTVRRARKNRSTLVPATLLLVAAAAILYAVFRPFLPAHAITQAAFQTYTAQAAYLKDIIYFVPFAAVFLLPPFHFIVRMQAALAGGQHRAVASVVLAERYAIPPSGVLYPRVWVLSALLIVGAIVSMISGAHLLENLKPTEYSNLFIHTIQFRWLVYLALGLETIAWYHHALTELRRECVVRQRLDAAS